MKKLTLSVIAFAAICTFAAAGGNEILVEDKPVAPIQEELSGNDAGFYLGAAYSRTHNETTITNGRHGEVDFDGVMLQAGYKFNPYVAVEARYWNMGDEEIDMEHPTKDTKHFDTEFDGWGIYLKPMYPVTQEIDIYALLGYGHQNTVNGPYNPSDEGFSWGLGASYSFTENVSVFIDYTKVYDDTAVKNRVTSRGNIIDVDVESSAWHVGLSYQF